MEIKVSYFKQEAHTYSGVQEVTFENGFVIFIINDRKRIYINKDTISSMEVTA